MKLLIFVFLFTGCAATQLQKEEIAVQGSPTGKKLFIEIEETRESYETTKNFPHGSPRLKQLVKETFEKVGFFSEVRIKESKTHEAKDADYILKVNMHGHNPMDSSGRFIWATIAGTTLFALPYGENHIYSLNIGLVDKRGKVLENFKTINGNDLVIWLPLLPLAPFFWPDNAAKKVNREMLTNLANQIANKIASSKNVVAL